MPRCQNCRVSGRRSSSSITDSIAAGATVGRPSRQFDAAQLRRPRHRAGVALMALALCSAILGGPAPPVRAQLLDDPPATVSAQESMTEAQREHAEAVALYAHARALLQRGTQAEGAEQKEIMASALQQFQRAWWWDHDLVTIMDEIVPLALSLNRNGEATRYAIMAAEQQDVPPALLQRIGAILAEQDRFADALSVYQKFLSQQPDPPDAVTLFEIGRLSLLTGRFEESAKAFARVRAALDGKNDVKVSDEDRRRILRNPELTYSLFGESFLRGGSPDDAEAMFRAAHDAKPNSAMLGLHLALVEQKRGNRDQALAHLNDYFASKSTSAGMLPYKLLAELMDPQAETTAADDTAEDADTKKPDPQLVARLQELSAADPNNPMLGYFLADQLRRAEQWDQAEAAYRRMLDRNPAADGHQGLIDIFRRQHRLQPLLEQLGDVAGQTGSLEPVEASVDPIVEDKALLQELLVETRKLMADTDHPPAAGILMAMALLAARVKDVEAADELAAAALRQSAPAAGPFAVALGFQWFQVDEARRAALAFQRIIDDKLLPDRAAEVYFYLAGAWTLAKEYDQALAAARQAARLEPNSPRMASREAWVLYQAKRVDEADKAYRALLERFDADREAPEGREVMRDARFVLSAMDVEREQLSEAEEWLQQVLDEFPEDIGAFNDLGYLWCDQGKHVRRAFEMLQDAVAAEPDNIAYRDSLGWALYRLGRFDESLVELKKATEGERVDGVIWDHLGDAYLKANQPDQALEAWRKAAAAFDEQQDVKRLEQIQAKIQQHASQ